MAFLEKMIPFEKSFGKNLSYQKDEIISSWLKSFNKEETETMFNDFYNYQKTGGKLKRLLA